MIKTPLCDLLNIKYPIFQGGMAWISDGRLAAAVSNAGGVGIISAMNADAGYVQGQIELARSLTDLPFGVNIMLLSPHVDEVAELVRELRVPLVTTGAGNPSKYIGGWKDAGVKVVPVIASVAGAVLMERLGADAVIAEGGESGGHVGETGTLPLVPQVVDAVSLPVIAAGGIGDGRGVAAALMLGAVGVQLGTRFLVADECNVHSNYKDKVIKATDISTVTAGKRTGHPVRSLKSPLSRAMQKADFDSAITDEEFEKMGVGAVRAAAVDGDNAKGSFLAGQIAGLIKKRQSAAEIVTELFAETEKILLGAGQWVK